MSKIAMLIEDEAQQAEFTGAILRRTGFDVHLEVRADAAVAALTRVPRPVDLVVLDRRLPQTEGSEPRDEVGDRLLSTFLDQLPDTPIVVFTGFTGVPHVQFATQERGVISLGPEGHTVDRVTAFEKSQSIEFESYVNKLSLQIDQLDDIEAHVDDVVGVDNAAVTRRLLKRAAVELDASSIRARPLTGGLTGSPVWLCHLSSQGVRVGTVVLKQSDRHRSTTIGGLHTLLPSSLVAAPLTVIRGMCDNQIGQLTQFAGSDPVSLLDLLSVAPQDAATHLERVAEAIKALISSAFESSATLAEICQPLVSDWSTLEERMLSLGVSSPRGTMRASTRRTAQHGDLHPGNVLVTDGQPVLIDFDNETVASSALDPITALLSPIFHADSPFREHTWPSLEQCSNLGDEAFFDGSPCEAWSRTAWGWLLEARTSSREFWGLIFAYAGRQLKYPDVSQSRILTDRAVALSQLAVSKISET